MTTTITDAPALKAALADGLLFASTDDARSILHALHLTVADQTLTIEATDSYTLVERTVEWPSKEQWEGIVDADDVRLILSLVRAKEPATVKAEALPHLLVKFLPMHREGRPDLAVCEACALAATPDGVGA